MGKSLRSHIWNNALNKAPFLQTPVENAQELSVEEESKSANRVTKISFRDLENKIDELIVGDDEDSKIIRRKLKEQASFKKLSFLTELYNCDKECAFTSPVKGQGTNLPSV